MSGWLTICSWSENTALTLLQAGNWSAGSGGTRLVVGVLAVVGKASRRDRREDPQAVDHVAVVNTPELAVLYRSAAANSPFTGSAYSALCPVCLVVTLQNADSP
jgi:hypothetical protein